MLLSLLLLLLLPLSSPLSSLSHTPPSFLGSTSYTHDSSLSLFSPPSSLHVLPLERFSRKKHDGGCPFHLLPLLPHHTNPVNYVENHHFIESRLTHPAFHLFLSSHMCMAPSNAALTTFSVESGSHPADPLDPPPPLPPPTPPPQLSHHLSHAYSTYPFAPVPPSPTTHTHTSGEPSTDLISVLDGMGSSLHDMLAPNALTTDLPLFPPDSLVYILLDSLLITSSALPPLPNAPPAIPLSTLTITHLNPSLTYRESESFYTLSHTSTRNATNPLTRTPIPLTKRFATTPTPPHIPNFGFEFVNSLGGVWSRLSQSLFNDWNAAGKVMGLGSYGVVTGGGGGTVIGGSLWDPRAPMWVELGREGLSGEPVHCKLGPNAMDFTMEVGEDGRVKEVGKGAGSKSVRKWTPGREIEEGVLVGITRACELQKDTNAIVIDAIRYLIRATNARGVICAGGVHQNSVLNGAIYEEGGGEVFVGPWPGDEGQAIGGCMYAAIEGGIEVRHTNERMHMCKHSV